MSVLVGFAFLERMGLPMTRRLLSAGVAERLVHRAVDLGFADKNISVLFLVADATPSTTAGC